MNLATHAGLIAGTSVLTIASTGTAGDLDSVIDGIINDSATISGDDGVSMSGLFRYGFTSGEYYDEDEARTGDDEYDPGVGEASLRFEGEAGGFHYTMDYNFTDSGFYEGDDGLNDYGFWHKSDAGWGVGMGRFRSWANKANNVDAADTLAMENSNVGRLIYESGGYSDMVFAWYEADQFRGGFQFADNDPVTDFVAPATWDTQENDFNTHYRVEFIAMGSWDDTDDFNSVAGTGQVLAFGFGGFEGNFDELGITGTHELTNYDVTYKNDAFGAHLAFGNVEIDNAAGVKAGEIEFMTLQASYYVQDAMQVFVTMEEIELDVAGPTPATDLDGLSPFTIGVNYWYGDDVKATIQYADTQFETDPTNGGALVEGDGVLSAQVQFTF